MFSRNCQIIGSIAVANNQSVQAIVEELGAFLLNSPLIKLAEAHY